MPTWLVVLLIIVVVVLIYFVSVRNSLVVLKNRVKDQFSQIDVQLKRRFDLIPNLVETVKGYTKHEKETLEEVIEARNKYLASPGTSDKLKADKDLSSAVNKLFALAESYPELKANENFKSLQNELSNCEDKITYARQFYNDSVLQLNNKIDMFPSNIVASMCHIEKEEFFKAEDSERENVKVKF